jgi:hypothetical protein
VARQERIEFEAKLTVTARTLDSRRRLPPSISLLKAFGISGPSGKFLETAR